MLTCRGIDPASVPPVPGALVGDALMRLDVTPPADKLPKPVRIQVTYPPDAVPQAERERLTLGYFDGAKWEPLPDQTAEPQSTRIIVMTDHTGVFALYRQP
jgi:hypothetical protein